jgi:hypothetical protein
MIAVHGKALGIRSLCQAFEMPRSSVYRLPKPEDSLKEHSVHHRSLAKQEETRVLETLNCERFRDVTPPEIYTTLLDEGLYLCSERTNKTFNGVKVSRENILVLNFWHQDRMKYGLGISQSSRGRGSGRIIISIPL